MLNAYISLKIKESQKKAFLIDSCEMTAIWQCKSKGLRKVFLTSFSLSVMVRHYAFIGSNFFQLQPEMYDVLIGAVNENHHWTLVVRLVDAQCEIV